MPEVMNVVLHDEVPGILFSKLRSFLPCELPGTCLVNRNPSIQRQSIVPDQGQLKYGLQAHLFGRQ